MTVRMLGVLIALVLMSPLVASADEGDLFRGLWSTNSPVDAEKRIVPAKQLPVQTYSQPTELPVNNSTIVVPASVTPSNVSGAAIPAKGADSAVAPIHHDVPKAHLPVELAKPVNVMPIPPVVPVESQVSKPVESAALPVAVTQMQAGDDYVIGIGDVLDISVWRDETLTKSVLVLPDGTLQFPLIDRVSAAGSTVRQLKSTMVAELSRYIPGLTLSLDVRQINSMVIYVIGRVNGPGRFAMTAPINVLQGLAMAGGLNPFAKRDDIKVFRQTEQGQQILPFHYDRVIRGELLSENVMLQRGDLIVVP